MLSDFAKEKVFWTRKMNIKLVKFIETRPNIWNPKHPKYTLGNFRDQTYAEFASKYGNEFTGRAVKDRWTNIRSTFAKYVRKLNASRAKGENEEYKVNWHLWEPCQFLMKIKKNVKTGNSEDFFEDNQGSDEPLPDEDQAWSENECLSDLESEVSNKCKNIANNLVEVFKGVQNDAFGINNTENGRIGHTVTETLSRMSSHHAAKASVKIMEILALYDTNNSLNPNSFKVEMDDL